VADPVLESGPAVDVHVLEDLSRDFQEVVDRITEEASNARLHALGTEERSRVEAAERIVDARAVDLRRGEGSKAAWQTALVEYEGAWRAAVRSLGERRN
jgi:hypothetical protein